MVCMANAQEKPLPASPGPVLTPAYGPLEMAEESNRLAEEQRLAAVEQQRELVAAAPYLYVAPTPSLVASVPYLYSGQVYRPRRAYRTGVWVHPRALVYPAIAADAYGGIPLPEEVRQPDGHIKYWTGPNGYVYRPTFRSPLFEDSAATGEPASSDPVIADADLPEPPAPPARDGMPKAHELPRLPGKPAGVPSAFRGAMPTPAPALPPAPGIAPNPAEIPAEAIPAPLAEPAGPRAF